MKNESMKKPQLKDYLNIHHYLKDLYQYRKQTEDGFSYEIWAQELDIKNRSYLRQLVIGRRSLTMDTANYLSLRLNLQGSDKEYFELLVRYSNARTQTQKNIFSREMIKLLKAEGQQQDIENYCEFVSNTLYPKLQTLLSFKDIEKTPETLSALLNKPAKDIESALMVLQKLELAKKEADQWNSQNRSFKVPDHIGDITLLDYHEQALKEAIKAKALPKDQRRYDSLLLPLSPVEFETFREDLKAFMQDTLRKFDSDDLRNRKLYQVNLNIYAVSEEPAFDEQKDTKKAPAMS